MKKYLKDLKIGRKLILSFSLVIMLYLITVASSVANFRDMSKRMNRLYEGAYANVEASRRMIANMEGVGRSLVIMCVGGSEVDVEVYYEKTKTKIESEEECLDILENGFVEDGEMIAELRSLYEELETPRDQVLADLANGKNEEAFEVYENAYEPKADIVRRTLEEVAEICTAKAESSLQETNDQNKMVIEIMIIVAVVVVLFTIIILFVIIKSILVPINEVKRAANEIAKGQLSVVVNYSATNELGELAEDVRNTAQALSQYVSELRRGLTALGGGRLNYNAKIEFKGDFVGVGQAMEEISVMLRDSLMQISSSAEQVSGGAEQVSNGAQELAHGASEQASSVEELAVSINEIEEKVRDNAENAVKSSQMADVVGKDLSVSNSHMAELMEAIGQIRANSREITGIVKEIEDIAFQTNILALNASVEAARAGDAGRGFSVVAGEVRRLAAKTSEASKLTAALIEKNATAVERGSEMVRETAGSLEESVAGAKAVTQMTETISEISVQQADAITQIRKSVELISEIVQGNSATSQESAAASEELSAQAQILKELVEHFEF